MRSRTGCLRCRTRRRKCDETKPICRNCISKGFKCQYGPKLTFLNKNAHTLKSPIVGSSGSITSSCYEDIRFVNEQPQNSRDGGEIEAISHNSPDSAPDGQNTLNSRITSNVDLTENFSPNDVSPMDVLSPLNAQQGVIFSDNDESAARGLLALGTTAAGDTQKPTGGRPSCHISQPSPDAGRNAVQPSYILQLLRQYRYDVAPWLDIFDLGQSFGIMALQMSTESQQVLSAILALSATTAGLLHPVTRANNSTFVSELESRQSGHTCKELVDALQEANRVISNISLAWKNPASHDTLPLPIMTLPAASIDLGSAIYWLRLRLELGKVLANDTSVGMPVPTSLPFGPSQLRYTTDIIERVYHYACIPLVLCTQTLQWCKDETGIPGRRTVPHWLHLLNSLEDWYLNRPLEFQPVLDIDPHGPFMDAERRFAPILFAHGAGVFGNQLYHTAMLLLLQSKPRTANITNLQPSMSPLWHAQRICGISLNNDRRESWDPCLLSSFLVAARCMSHESQQREILCGFELIKTLTGWDMGEYLVDLRESRYFPRGPS